ncbi:hypothetical protein NET02_09105 [Thermomicrobiaceae bacterium CFH 74404]|uniref:Uncharacterized protein n=1 Tax=Thermalbibacter longus TaxID=2951981 RepID=A0AA41WDW0_9BACT|nr:hypothetical protein [Thermalbibacter longus]MCM8749303.1 hypothetical protein [Thermalbibacter longus]
MVEGIEAEVLGWFIGRIPEGWFTQPPELTMDRDEILVVGRLAEPSLPEGAAPEARAEAVVARIQRFREETRPQRMRIATEAEHRFGRKVSWGVVCGDRRELFTVLSVPVMTRLRLPERQTLDTLVEAGVARSRSEALAWCVRLVAKHQSEWLAELREALVRVQQLRQSGPELE